MVSINIDNNTLLRSYNADDASALFNVVNASRKHLHTWLDWVDKTTKEEHSLQFIQQSLHHLETQEGLALGIFYNGRIIGGIGMHHWEQLTKRAQVGYWISKEYEGKGIMNKCMVKFIGFLFEKIGLNKVEIHFLPGNKRSAKVAERLGFKIEGVIRQSVMRNGKPEDIVIAGLLKKEFTPNP
ncbi:MAG: GNAT family N-acetyltransferase [Chitinophagales bacterium]